MDLRARALAAGLFAVDVAADLSAALFPRRPAAPLAAGVGATLSILIPERGTPELLYRCLESVFLATRSLDAPPQVLVVVNGHTASAYAEHAWRFPAVEWIHERHALGFGGAVEAGLARIRGDWVYLLNSDMVIAGDALSTLWSFRDAQTFAIASQIHFADPNRRREETGWTDFIVRDGVTEHLDRVPEDERRVRGHLYAGGGASLFRTEILRRYIRNTTSYGPFYFEDADWGMQACRAGLHIKFCPLSAVVHEHRATISRYFDAVEIERVIRRNVVMFEARHGLGGRHVLLQGLPRLTRSELTRPATLVGLCLERWRTRRARRAGMAPELAPLTVFNAPLDPARRTRLVTVKGSIAEHSDALMAEAAAASTTGQENLVLVTDDGGVIRGGPPWTRHFNVIHCLEREGRSGRSAERRFGAAVAWWSRVYAPDTRKALFTMQPSSGRRASDGVKRQVVER
jgi:GT2 family glycosyltransferase